MPIVFLEPICTETDNEATVEWIMRNSRNDEHKEMKFIDSASAFFFSKKWYIRIHPSDKTTVFRLFLRRECFHKEETDQHIHYKFRIMNFNLDKLYLESKEQEFLFLSHFNSTPHFDIPREYHRSLEKIFKTKTSVKIFCFVKLLNAPISEASLQSKKSSNREVNYKFRKEDFPALTLPKDSDRLPEHFKELLETKQNADVTIKVKDQTILAHQVVLEIRCPVFASMFTHDMKEKQTKEITIIDCEPESFNDFLAYLYTGQVDHITGSNASDLYKIADKYDRPELKSLCKDYLLSNLSIDSFLDTLCTADMHNDYELMESVTKYFFEYGPKIIKTDQWLEFLQEHPHHVTKILEELFKYFSFLYTPGDPYDETVLLFSGL